MPRAHWNPFGQLASLQEDADRQVEELVVPVRSRFANSDHLVGPAIDVLEQGDTLVVKTAVPGIKPDDLTIAVKDDRLTIAGQVGDDTEATNGRFYRRERAFGHFQRSLALPFPVSADGSTATLEDGILTVRLTKSPTAGSQQIPVQPASGPAAASAQSATSSPSNGQPAPPVSTAG